ncbi:Crossover junction endonuclease mus81 [Conglomerata obtusa]
MHDFRPKLIEITTKQWIKANFLNLQTKHVYKKILDQLKAGNSVISNITDLKIKGVGKKTKELFLKEVFEKGSKSENFVCDNKDKNDLLGGTCDKNLHTKELEQKDKNRRKNKTHKENQKREQNDVNTNSVDKKLNNNMLRCKSINIESSFNYNAKSLSHIEINKEDNIPNKTSKLLTKPYLPKYKSGSYAILRVLSIENGLSKQIICNRANKYSNYEFNPLQRFSAWNGMKTLIDKNFILKESKKYFLTDSGKDLCRKLFNEINSDKKQENSDFIVNSDISFSEHSKKIVLMIDSREMKSKKDRSYFQRNIPNSETIVLEVGDFLWLKGEKVLNYIIERKKGSDFVSSISDGRFNEQKRRLKETGIKNIFYIVEDLKERDMIKIGVSFVISCLNSTKNEGFIVIETQNINETVEVIKIIDTFVKEEEKKKFYNKNDSSDFIYDDIVKKNFETQKDFSTETNNNLQPKNKAKLNESITYDHFIEKGSKNLNFKCGDIFYKALLSVKGLSHEKALFLNSKFKTFNFFYLEMSKTNFLDELGAMDINGKIIGKNIAKKIIELFN